MKQLIITFCFSICTHFIISQTVVSSCAAPDSIKALYINDADRLALKRIYQQNLTYSDSIVIPQAYTDTILRALIAIYNATALPARNAVVSQYNIHTFPYPIMNRLNVAGDSLFSWMQQLKLGIIPTGNSQVDNLISTHSLSIQNYNSYNGFFSFHIVTFKSDSNYNIVPLTDIFETIPGVAFSETLSVVGDGNTITASIFPTHVELTYSLGWGDCPAGCTARHYWKFNVYYDCSVEFLGESGNPIPVPPTPTISVLGSKCTNETVTVTVSGANSGSLNSQPLPASQFTLSSPTPTSYVILASYNAYPGLSSASVSISFIDCAAPTISVSGSNCTNDTLTVSILGAIAYSLNNQSLPVSQFTLSSPTSTSYIVLASNSTYSTSKSISVIDCSTLTSIGEHELYSNLSIYPNPANEHLELGMDNSESLREFNSLSIYNGLGQLVKEEEIHFENKALTINVEDLDNGVYFLRLKSDRSETISKRFVVAR